MDPMTQAALERLETAIEGRPYQGVVDGVAGRGFTGVICGDVILVAESVAERDRDDHVKALLAGAKNNRAEVEEWFMTERLAHLMAIVKG